ncbi:MAG: hypothetical protein IH964_09120 [Candidatus Dadabacteria bacterium]|nr:hypothetical protein [Candidatus Dadabacteria bacterium]
MTESVVDITQYKFDQAEKELREKLVDYSERPEMQSQIGEAFYIWKNDPEFTSEDISEEEIDELTFEKFLDWFLYDFKLLDSKERVIERFYIDEGKELSDAEKRLIKDWIKSIYSFFEVEEVLSDEKCVIKDIFTGKVFEISDRASSKQIKRRDIIAARPLKIGNQNYFSGIVSLYPATFKNLITEFFDQEFKEYKKLYGNQKTKREYLKDWGFQIGYYIEDVANHPHFVTPEGDEFVLAIANYFVDEYEQCIKNIEKIKSLKEISDKTEEIRIFSWEKIGRNKITGILEIEKTKLRIECYSIDMLARAKSKIEKECKGLIKHLEDTIKEQDTFIDRNKSETKKLKKYPLGVKNKKELDSELDKHYDKWLNMPLEILDGKSPKQALKTKDGRVKLSSMINELEVIYEHARNRGEPYYDVSKLRKKLKLI